LHEKWNNEGLTVLGITSESKGQTEPWIEEAKAHYGYAYDKARKLSTACGVSGIPHAVLIDASGKIVYSGSPGGITNDIVSKATTGALKTPLYSLPKEMAKVRKLLAKDDLSGAIAECESLAKKSDAPPEAAATAEALRAMIASTIESADALGKVGNWLEAQEVCERMLKAAKGLPEEALAKEKLASMSKDKDIQKEIKAQKALAKVLSMPLRKEKDVEAMADSLRHFIKRNPETFASKEAERKLSSLENPK
jgi:hypothetical protein